MFYVKILLAGHQIEGDPAPVPNFLLGLNDESLSDLGWLEDSTINIYGYWPLILNEVEVPPGWRLTETYTNIQINRDTKTVTADPVLERINRQNAPSPRPTIDKQLNIEQGSGNGLRFWDGSPDLSIYAADASDGTWGGRIGNETNSALNIYFNTRSSNGFVFRNNDIPVAGIDSDGNLRIKGAAYINHPTNTWTNSTDGINRSYYTRGGRTIYKSADGAFEFRNNSDTELASILGTGTLNVYHSIRTNTGKNSNAGVVFGSAGDIVDLGDQYCSVRFAAGMKIYSSNKSGNAVITLGSDGSIFTAGSIVGLSDLRTKFNIDNLTNVLPLISCLRPVKYIQHNKPSIGLIAQEVKNIFPELVESYQDNGVPGEYPIYYVNYQNMVAVALAGIRELNQQVTEHEQTISQLQSMVHNMASRLADLEKRCI